MIVLSSESKVADADDTWLREGQVVCVDHESAVKQSLTLGVGSHVRDSGRHALLVDADQHLDQCSQTYTVETFTYWISKVHKLPVETEFLCSFT